ncbi:hypothetical protein CTI12_AA128120 [Artemisia annua]|uniref:Helitron helicase-like domain-containing protein n=1 Tax=Artemisia annua TaxID=35608 RepID=A0A2U1PMZ7_ARTAN|nr:hypothetical protein CTI12_AA128120 [Artemisia annua]
MNTGVQTVEQFQKPKPGRQQTTHTMNQPSDHSRPLTIQETSVAVRPGRQTMENAIHLLQDNQMAPRPRGRPRNDSTKKPKQPIYAGDIQSDVHSSKRKSERLKQKTKLSRLKISQGGFVRPTWVGDENDPRTNTFVGISRGVQTVEQFQKRKLGRQQTTHTMNQPSDHSRPLTIQETSVVVRPGRQTMENAIHLLQDNQMAPRPRGRPRNDSTKKHYIEHGNPIYKCGDCNTLLWQSESMVGSTHTVNGSYSLCCGRGKVMLTNEIVNPPPLLLDLIIGNNSKSSSFIDNIRRYNSMFAFTSIGAKQDNTVNKGYGPYCYRIQGENYHQMGTLLPKRGKPPVFAQLYIYDKASEIQNRMNCFSNDETTTSGTNDLGHELTAELRDMLDSINPLVAQFRMAGEQFVSAKNRNKLKLRLIEMVPTLGMVVFGFSIKENACKKLINLEIVGWLKIRVSQKQP